MFEPGPPPLDLTSKANESRNIETEQGACDEALKVRNEEGEYDNDAKNAEI